MKLTKHTSRLVIVSIFLVLIACANTQPINFTAIEQAKIQNLNIPSSTTLASGQPTKAQLKVIAESGVRHVVNLRPKSELDWDERAYVESLGMQYHNIPVNGIEGITFANADKLSQLLSELKDEPTLLHCSSGNRVGALKALNASQPGNLGIDSAIAEGKRFGLTRLEPVVRKKLEKAAK